MDTSKPIFRRKDNLLEDLNCTITAFNNLIKPLLKKYFVGEFISVEGDSSEISKQLDMLAGIDVLWITKEGLRGVASRIQFTEHNWRTFTIRASRSSGSETELSKRTNSIKDEYLYPYLTVQAYVDKDKVLGMGAARTKDILKMISKGNSRTRTSYDCDGSMSCFHFVEFYEMQLAGYHMIEYKCN